MGSPLKGSDHIKPPDRKGPSYGDCSKGSGRHMALISKKLASNAALYEVLCICSGRGPKETRTKGLAYKGLGCGMMAAKTSMYFSQELSSLVFGDTSLKDLGSTFLV